MSYFYVPYATERSPNARHMADMLPISYMWPRPPFSEPRRQVRHTDFARFPEPQAGKGVPNGWYDWYDWVLVWRYWHGQADGLRRPCLLEIGELLRLGAGLSSERLALRLDRPERTILRWRARLA